MQEIKKINLSLELRKFSELTINFDKERIPLSSSERESKKGKYPYYGAQGIIDHVDEYIFDGEYLLIAEDGENLNSRSQPIANVVLGKFWVNNHAHIVKTNSKCEIHYLCYLLNNINISGYITGSAQPKLNQYNLNNMVLEIQDYETQYKISIILKRINDKIKLNEKINKNLEEQLLRIFDSWFLKFELSNEFSDSKLGLIPKGWKIDYLGSKKSCSIIKSGIDEFDNSKIYIATADVDNSIITSNDTLITMDDKPSRANMQPISNSIWFAKMIDSKKLIMVDEYCNDLLNNYIFSTGFCGLKCVDKYFYYLWTFLLTDVFDVMKNNFCTGTTMQAINNKDTKLIEFVLPDDKTITQFNSIAKPMFKKIYYNNLEIKKLQRLRDTLLPKLMSGEIDVSEVNCDLKIIIRKIYIKSSKLFLWRYLSENKNYIKNTKSNETLLKSRTIYKINKFLAKFNARYRYYRQ